MCVTGVMARERDECMIGTTVGTRFHIVGRIGDGWLFTVYRARDQLTGQLVAVKVVRPTFAVQRSFVEALIRAVERHIHYAHPALVRYLTVGETTTESGPLPFVVCELVAGHDLAYLLQRRLPMPLRQALDLFVQIADGIGYLHQQGAVHGDLRPHNVLVAPRGEVKVGDFGLWSVFLSSRVAETEWMERVAPYLAPERFQGDEATPQSDVYALGVLLFQMITGHLPFEATRVADFAHLHLTAPVPLASSIHPAVPSALDTILLRAMAKDPHQRFTHGGELRNAVLEILATITAEQSETPLPEPSPSLEPASAEEAPRVWQRMTQSALGLVGGLVLGLMLVSGVIYGLLVGTKPKEVVVPDITGMRLSQAQQVLMERNLRLRVVRWEFSKEVPAEHILRMEDPLPNQRVLEGREVLVVASQGAAKAFVPNLAGRTFQEALAELKRARLRLGLRVETHSETVPKGYVLGQQPPPNVEVPEDTPVNLIVSKGSPPPEPEIDWAKLPPNARVARVAIVVGGTELQQLVQIFVSDSHGEREVYRGTHVPGDRVTKTVIGYGPAKVRVLVNGQEVAPPEEL